MITLEEAKKNSERLLELRRYFHENPAVTGHEEKTIEKISSILTEDGIDHEVIKDGGILAYIYGKGYEPEAGHEPWKEGYVEDGDSTLLKDGCGKNNLTLSWKMKTVLLRADVDALYVKESDTNLCKKKVCVSKDENVSHACGHDSHIAMVLCAAEYLNNHRDDIKGRVIIMFERGEEGPNNIIFIIRRMIEKNLHIDSVCAAHVYAGLSSGKVAAQEGPVMGGGVFYQVIIKGRGGHGSRPDMAANPIDCYTAVQEELNSFRGRYLDPFHTFTYAPTIVRAGALDNVIPGELLFGGNARLYELSDGVKFREFFFKTLDSLCPLYGCTYEVLYCVGPKIPVKNDRDCAALAKKAAAAAVGSENVCEMEPWMACESICTMLAIFPGVFLFVGNRNPEKGTGAIHHSPEFDVDEDVMPGGFACEVNYVLSFLENDVKPGHGWFDGSAADLYEVSNYNPGVVSMLRYGTPYQITEGLR